MQHLLFKNMKKAQYFKDQLKGKYPFLTQYQRHMVREAVMSDKILFNYVRNTDFIKIYNILVYFINLIEKIYYIAYCLILDFIPFFEKWFKVFGIRYAVPFSLIVLLLGWPIKLFIIYILYHIYEAIKMVSLDYLRTKENTFIIQLLTLNCIIHYIAILIT